MVKKCKENNPLSTGAVDIQGQIPLKSPALLGFSCSGRFDFPPLIPFPCWKHQPYHAKEGSFNLVTRILKYSCITSSPYSCEVDVFIPALDEELGEVK